MLRGILFFVCMWAIVWTVMHTVARQPVYYFRQFAIQGLKALFCTTIAAVIVLCIVYLF